MAVVKGSKQIKMVVVPHRPMRGLLLTLGALFVTVILTTGGIYYGYTRGTNENITVRIERDQLSIDVNLLQEQQELLQQNFVNVEQASLVDKQALVEVQDMMVGLREINAQLEEDVLFYRQIMSPENNETGLAIGQLDLSATEEENRIRYHIELKQLTNNENVISGYANVNIFGMQEGNEVSFPLRSIASDESQLDIRLQFRYFQNIEGELIIPENFIPETVQILAVSQGENAKTVQKNFVWVVER
ncbi:MAG: hypothetical protein COA71_04720 [SAR86 cluster bacterium]|uniref:Uncharacterized protein n=1 Tax=SAR86 cluster bacterium TaxID=2030880 RepID=A0A2A5CGZ6_9GAMM|nr:MAG: hypothetical protein COA71_04720 [SAR86 cluster bacterium]